MALWRDADGKCAAGLRWTDAANGQAPREQDYENNPSFLESIMLKPWRVKVQNATKIGTPNATFFLPFLFDTSIYSYPRARPTAHATRSYIQSTLYMQQTVG